jgi:hypothetical protein
MAEMKRCPICLTESVGGKPHEWHKSGHKKKGYTTDQISNMVKEVLEQNQIKAIICEAVDLARQPTDWRSNPKKSRKKYHREYYWRHVVIRRQQRVTSKMMRKKLKPLIDDLCHAVDLGRISATW